MRSEYPTEEELEIIRKWGKDHSALMGYVYDLWWMPDWGWHESDGVDDVHERPVRVYNLSTGGWSGNEDLLSALRDNFIFWSVCWVSKHRGGHYEFYVPK